MGGLILENKSLSTEGLPLISRIPIIGGLFGDQVNKNDRTELILFITPHVVENEVDVNRVIEDLRRRMELLESVFPVASKPVPQPAAPEKTAPEGAAAPGTVAK